MRLERESRHNELSAFQPRFLSRSYLASSKFTETAYQRDFITSPDDKDLCFTAGKPQDCLMVVEYVGRRLPVPTNKGLSYSAIWWATISPRSYHEP